MGLLQEVVELLRGRMRRTPPRHEPISSARNPAIRTGMYVTADDLEHEREELRMMFPKREGSAEGQADLRRPE